MKRKIIAAVIAASVLLTGCSLLENNRRHSRSDRDDDEIEEEEDEDEDEDEEEEEEDEEETEAPTPSPTPTATPTPTPTPEPTQAPAVEITDGNFFEDQGLTITPQGDFVLVTEFMLGAYYGLDIEVPSNVVITETTEGVEEGYKEVTAVFTVDFTEYFMNGDLHLDVDDYPSQWISAFDRYSGVSFEPGDVTIPVEHDGVTYDIVCGFDWQYDYEDSAVDTITVTVKCPVDYDGTVFYIGHGSGGVNDINDDGIDYEARLYRIDEFPFYEGNGYPYTFFSLTND